MVAELAEDCGYRVAGLWHRDGSLTGTDQCGHLVLGSYDDLCGRDLTGVNLALSPGNIDIRARLYDRFNAAGATLPTLVHPLAKVSRHASLGRGVQVFAGAVVHPNVTLGDDVSVYENAVVTHCTRVGDHGFIGFGALVGSYIDIAERVFIGIGAILISGKVATVGARAMIAAGAVVTRPVSPAATVVGSPAKPL